MTTTTSNPWYATWHKRDPNQDMSNVQKYKQRNTDKIAEGWKVVVKIGLRQWAIPVVFPREQDAAAAANALNAMRDDWATDVETLREQCLDIGLKRIHQTMMEALQW